MAAKTRKAATFPAAVAKPSGERSLTTAARTVTERFRTTEGEGQKTKTSSSSSRKYYRYSTGDETDSDSDSEVFDGIKKLREPVEGDAAAKKDQVFLKKLIKKYPDAATRFKSLFPGTADAKTWRQGGPQTQTTGHTTVRPTETVQSQALEGAPKSPERNLNTECTAAVLSMFMLVSCSAFIAMMALKFTEPKGNVDVTGSDRQHVGQDGFGPGPDDSEYQPPGGGSHRTAVTYRANYSSDLYRRADHRVVCVYQVRSQHLVAVGSEYGVQLFPYPYCHLAVYCCLTLDGQYAIVSRAADPVSFYVFRTLAASNPHAEPRAIIGGLPEENDSFRLLLDTPQARKDFITNARTWCRTNQFRGLYLYWKYPPPNSRDNVTSMVREISEQLSRYNVSLGLVVVQRPQQYAAFDVPNLSALLTSGSILLVPPTYAADDYKPNNTFAYYANDTITDISLFAGNPTEAMSSKICVLLSAAALTLDPLGPGPAGPITKQEGRQSYFETCSSIPVCNETTVQYSEALTCNDTRIHFVSPGSIRNFICAVKAHAGTHCFGIWDSDFDDFPGHCGFGHFPLMRAVFERPLHPCVLTTCSNDTLPCV